VPTSIVPTFTAKVEAACRQAADKVVPLARQTGTPIIIWDHDLGQVRAISADEAQEQLSGIPSPEVRANE
jgi:hypothetical protein